MKNHPETGGKYLLPKVLSPFQREMYIHLINQKRAMGIKDPGIYHYRGKKIEYDAILPKSVHDDLRFIYEPVRDRLRVHQQRFPFRRHLHFNHVVSSQAANINLFLPLFHHKAADPVLAALKDDFKKVAVDKLDNGFRIEFWGGETAENKKGLLGDHTSQSGTDSDIAIAYYNKQDQLCLWLIEHKLTEKEFTACGGYKSKGRKDKHDCSQTFEQILENKDLCYYHDVRGFNYWDITDTNQSFFANHKKHEHCPFKGGMNQLWRNQLLALSIEQDKSLPYEQVFFSVVHHPRNDALNATIEQYRHLIADNRKFSVFTSRDVVEAARGVDDAGLNGWVRWYGKIYSI